MAHAPALDVSVILRLVDQLSAPAKKSADNLKLLNQQFAALKKSAGIDAVERQVSKLQRAVASVAAELRTITGLSNQAFKGMKSASAAATAGWGAQVQHLQKIAGLQQQLIRNQGALGRAAGHGIPLVAGLGLGFGAHRAGHAIASAFGKAGSLDAERAWLDMAGYSVEQQRRINDAVLKAVNVVPQMTTAEGIHRVGELTYAFGDLKHALEALVPTAKVMQNVHAALGAERGGAFHDQVMELVKAGELQNFIKTPEEFQRWLDWSSRIAVATRGLVSPAMTFQALKYARSAIHAYDDEFRSLFLPELTQEFATGRGGGGRGSVGPSLANFKKLYVDSQVAAKYIPALLGSGLIDPSKIDYDSHGKPKALLPGAFYGNALAAANPFRFVESYIMPALQKAGVDLHDHNAIVRKISEWGGTDIAKQLIQSMVIQHDQMVKRTNLSKQAGDAESQFVRAQRSWNQTVEATTKTWGDLVASVMQKATPFTGSILRNVTGVLGWLRNLVSGDYGQLAVGGAAGLAGLGAMALLPRLLGGGLLTRLAIGGVGAMLLGPGGAFLGAVTGLGTAATGAAAALGTVTAALSALAGIAATLGAAYGLTKWGNDTLNQIGTFKSPDKMGWWEKVSRGLATEAWDPYARGFEPKNNAQKGGGIVDSSKASADGSSAGSAWYSSFWSTVKAGLASVTNLVPTGGLTAQGAAAGRAWAQAFIGAAQGAMAGALLQGPKVTPPSVSGAAAAGAGAKGAAGKESRLHSRNVSIVNNFHVHGADQPHKVADLVHKTFARAVEKHLSDGAFA